MTQRFSFPLALLCALVIGSFTTEAAAAKKKAAPAAKASRQTKNARADRGREKASDRKSAREQRADRNARGRSSKAERAADTRASNRRERASKNDRRNAREEKAAARNDKQKDPRRMSRRERAAEIARRRREEAARRAEIARQAAIARAIALARQRAADQALRDETVNNILKDETTGEDLEVRRAAVEALGNHAGTVVVMDPKNGRVYATVNQDWALRKGFKPCSTVKLVTGVAGLTEGAISPLETVNVSSGGSYGLDLTSATAVSNNGYFQRVGGIVGFDKMMSYARKLGLGETTGINYVNESPGRLPLFKSGYAVNHMSSHGDDIEVTPIQLATMTSALANGGTLLVPHLPRTPEETFKFKREVKRQIDIPQENVRRLIPGMVGAVNYGTARGAQDPTQTVAGKTGTCVGQGSWLGLFTSYAPVQDPQLAVVVVTRGSGERGRIAASVAGRIYRSLNHRFGNRGGARPVLANDLVAAPPRIDPRKAAILSDEDKEVEASDDAFVVSEADNAGATTNTQSNVRSTVKTYEPSRNMNAQPAPSMNKPATTDAPQGSGRPRRVSPINQ